MPQIKANLDSLLIFHPLGYRINFGKYKGSPLVEVPGGYLRWCLENMEDLPDEFVSIVSEHLEEKKHEGVGTFDFGDYDEDFR